MDKVSEGREKQRGPVADRAHDGHGGCYQGKRVGILKLISWKRAFMKEREGVIG